MKYIVHKAYWDYEKEERWLNEMSAKGMTLSDYSWCRYVFVETPNNEYIYRIELLKNLAAHPESIKYIKFLEENGIEFVTSYLRWIYLRKKSSEGEFEIYSDIESKIKHYSKINLFWTTMATIEFVAGIINLFAGLMNLSEFGRLFNVNFVLGGLLFLLGAAFLKLDLKIRKKIKILVQEKNIRE